MEKFISLNEFKKERSESLTARLEANRDRIVRYLRDYVLGEHAGTIARSRLAHVVFDEAGACETEASEVPASDLIISELRFADAASALRGGVEVIDFTAIFAASPVFSLEGRHSSRDLVLGDESFRMRIRCSAIFSEKGALNSMAYGA